MQIKTRAFSHRFRYRRLRRSIKLFEDIQIYNGDFCSPPFCTRSTAAPRINGGAQYTKHDAAQLTCDADHHVCVWTSCQLSYQHATISLLHVTGAVSSRHRHTVVSGELPSDARGDEPSFRRSSEVMVYPERSEKSKRAHVCGRQMCMTRCVDLSPREWVVCSLTNWLEAWTSGDPMMLDKLGGQILVGGVWEPGRISGSRLFARGQSPTPSTRSHDGGQARSVPPRIKDASRSPASLMTPLRIGFHHRHSFPIQ